MANSDIKSEHIVADTTAVSVAAVAAASQPNTDFTLTTTGGVVFDAARIVTATTSGTSDKDKVVTITGTDLDGDAITETITLTSTASTVSGTKYFKSVTAASISVQPAGNVAVGIAAGAADKIYAGRARLRGAFIVNSAAAGTITFLTSGSDGAERLKLGTVASATAERDVSIPDEGILFENGIYVAYTGGASAIFTNMTTFRS